MTAQPTLRRYTSTPPFDVDLDDKYRRETGRVFLSGTQALVRLLLIQKRRDQAQGLTTAGFVSGYRGSPLGGFDRELWQAKSFLDESQIEFCPGINEDLAATAVWGSQMLGQHGAATVDGVFAMWYGKGAGLDRSGDAIRHANASGVQPRGGVLAVVGDDHAQKSSTQPYFSEPSCADLLIPVLYPSNVPEILEYGLLGWGMSRFSGSWVALKTMAEILDCSTSFDERSVSLEIRHPSEFAPPAGSVHFRWPDPWHEAEIRWIEHRLPAIHAFARANQIDRVALRSPRPRLGIVTAGKSYSDLLQALQDIGLTARSAGEMGLTIYKVGMTWPIEQSGLREFASGLPEILVIEEKRPIIEDQLRAALFDGHDRPKITGKKDETGNWQFPWVGELSADRIVRVLAQRLPELRALPAAQHRLAALEHKEEQLKASRPKFARPPYFCSGCPHSKSTKIPANSLAIGGVGCHYMAVDMDRSTATFSHMGGEGATWIGQAPFSTTRHVFVNLGEGTYFHSGSLAVRACVAAGVNITYKLLYNDAVAMTGGQPVDGELTVPQLAQQLYAEGIRGIHIVAEEPEKYAAGADLPPQTAVHHRSRLDEIQRALRQVPGVTALIYDQTCAAEKRRRRKRAQMPDPEKRVFINADVCEGCGDCSVASNCLSVVPLDTELGRKRAIDQSSCNKDFSCVEGFCPSFVTVIGGRPRRPKSTATDNCVSLSEPVLPNLADSYDIFITGVGGTGVVTVGAILGMAAHLEGRACSILDQLGMAQKGGAVVSHVRIGNIESDIRSARVRTAGADLLLGFDLAVSLQDAAFSKISRGRTHVILNTHETITGAFTRNPDLTQPTLAMLESIKGVAGEDRTVAFDAIRIATALLGDSIAANMLVLGYAFQRGLIPLSRAAILEAIRLNGTAVEFNVRTFELGRRAAVDGTVFERAISPAASQRGRQSIDELIEFRATFLTAYQDTGYAKSYREFIAEAKVVERLRGFKHLKLSEAVARSLFKLMAYKDEYEVARLYTSGRFLRSLEEQFESATRLVFHLAPPIFAPKDALTGHLRKRAYGPWMYQVFRVLARLKRLRGTKLDPFGYTRERRVERQLITDYRSVIELLLANLTPDNHELAVRIAEIPMRMRGFGHVKELNVKSALQEQRALLEEFSVVTKDTSATLAAAGGT